MSPTLLIYFTTLSVIFGLEAKLISDDDSDSGNYSTRALQLDNDTSLERTNELNNSLQVGDFSIPVILDLNITGQLNESRVIKINCRPKTLNPSEAPEFYGPKPLLERSVCDFTVQEAMVMVGFLFVLLVMVLSGLFLCCSSGREDTIPVALVSKTLSEQRPSSPNSSQVHRGGLESHAGAFY